MRRAIHSEGNPPGAAAAPRDAIAQAAATWVVRRDRGLSTAEHRSFLAWKSADPRHAAEFDRIANTWRDLDGIGAAPDLAAQADEVVVRARTRRARRRLVRLMSFTAAAAATVAFGILGWNRIDADAARAIPQFPSESYRVLASTVEREILPDGSTAALNGASRISVEFTATERRVRLVDGEVHFIVAPNPERPFFVSAGPVTVRAVGTAFNVRLAAEMIEVLVTEGEVKIERAHPEAAPRAASQLVEEKQPSALIQGQRAVISLAADVTSDAVSVGEVDQGEMEAALGWQSTRLVFNNTPLDEVVNGFNRYNAHRLTLGDPKLRQRTLTGVFRADNLDGFTRLLKASIDVKAEQRTPTETVLLPVR